MKGIIIQIVLIFILFLNLIFAQPEYYESKNLTLITQYIPKNKSVFGVKIYKNYVFLLGANEILDVSDVSIPKSFNIPGLGFHQLEIVNNFAYGFTGTKLMIFNLDYLPTFIPINNFDLITNGACINEDLIFHYTNSGNFSNSTSTFNIINLEDPIKPKIVGSTEIPSTSHGIIYINSSIVYLGCSDGLRIMDISNTNNPKIFDLKTKLGAPLGDGILLDDYLVINKVFSAQLLVVDIQDPLNPKEIWYYDYYGNGFIDKIGSQGNFIFATSPEKNSYLEMFNINDTSSHQRTGYFQNKIRGGGGGIAADENYIYYGGIDNFEEPPNNGNGGLFILKNDLISSVEKEKQLSKKIELSQNYPNPFNPSTIINYTIPLQPNDVLNAKFALTTNVILKVYNILGKEVATLVNKNQTPGNYQVEFDGSNLPSGVYFYRLQSGNFIETKKMVLLR